MLEDEFTEFLLGHWDNAYQAQCNPSNWAHIHYKWYLVGNTLCSKQWYEWSGQTYRERSHKVKEVDGKILLETFRDANIKETDMWFEKTDTGFKGGTIEGAVNHKGVKVFSEVVITKEKFTTVDKGDDGVTWGNTPGPFVFKRKYID